MSEIEDAEVVDEVGTELAVQPVQPISLFGTTEPKEVIEKASAHATALADVIRSKQLFTRISGRDHVRVEGWQLLGSMVGVYAVVTETNKLEDGWEARCEARTLAGQVVGAADAQCTRGERTWSQRDEYALRSMAQTRAISKALKSPLGFIVSLAGYSATPAEEIPHEEDQGPSCPKCGSPVWDNSQDPNRGKRPIFKCKDKTCDFASWNENEFKSGGSTQEPPTPDAEPQGAVPSEAASSSRPPWLRALLQAGYQEAQILEVTNSIRAERTKPAEREPLEDFEEVAKARPATQKLIQERLANSDWSVPKPVEGHLV